MRKIAVFFILVIIIVCAVFALYINYRAKYIKLKKENLEYEKYLQEEIYGTELMTIINRAINNNEKNKVEKNEKGLYINDQETSVQIDIKMSDNNTIYKMETIYKGGIQNFINYYGNIKFKCTNIQYHNNTNKVKYLLFEQITE